MRRPVPWHLILQIIGQTFVLVLMEVSQYTELHSRRSRRGNEHDYSRTRTRRDLEKAAGLNDECGWNQELEIRILHPVNLEFNITD